MNDFTYSLADIKYLEEVKKIFEGTIIWDVINTFISDNLGNSIFVFKNKKSKKKLVGMCSWWENAIFNYCSHPKTLVSSGDLFSVGYSEMVKCLHRYMNRSIKYRFSDVSEIEFEVAHSRRYETRRVSIKESLEHTFVGRAVEFSENDFYLPYIEININNPKISFLRGMTRSEAIMLELLFELRKSTKLLMERVAEQRDKASEPKLYEMATSLELLSRIIHNIFNNEFYECAERVSMIAGGLYRVDY